MGLAVLAPQGLSMQKNVLKQPSIADSVIPIFVLIGLLATSVALFGDNSSYGPNQVALLLSSGVAMVIGLKNGSRWEEIEKGLVKGITIAIPAILILFAVGALIGTWLLAGTVPTLVYFGLKVIDPSIFYATTCVLCALVALSIGSSWTVAATVGVALIGVAKGLGLSVEITAGAIISGAYFGDKMSPLSETTNLAPAVAGSELFAHIRHMVWTSVPSIIIALIAFTILGFGHDAPADVAKLDAYIDVLEANFTISVWNLLPLLLTLTLALRKVPAFPAVAIGALAGGAWAVLMQPELIAKLAADHHGQYVIDSIRVVWMAMFDGIVIDTGNADLNDLLSGGGMSGMLNTVWLIICAMAFGAVLESLGLLQRLVEALLSAVKSTGALISATLATCIGTNLVAADQYIAIVLPGRMYQDAYKKQGLDAVNLSRSLEDAATITSPLIPWNTCGAYMHSVLLVNPADYLAYCFFNWTSPMIAAIFGFLGVKIKQIKQR